MLQDKFLNESTKMAIRSRLTGLRLGALQSEHGLPKIDAIQMAEDIILNLS